MGIWDDPHGYNANRYGEPDAPGTPAQWKAAYEDVMGRAEAEEVLSGSKRRGSPEQKARTILKITIETLTVDTVKAAYRKLVFKVHPDHGGDAEQFKEVHAAYSLLMDALGANVK
tara:strand:+ start:162348 stop:162692 length:345 start_codon:yes stop_codon:yes gene_type:complete